MAIATSKTVVLNATKAHALQCMRDLHALLLAAGLTQEQVAGGFDVDGDESQIPNAVRHGAHSPWMVFSFNDGRQAADPIAVSFRVVGGDYGANSSQYMRYFLQARVSGGVDGVGNALGAQCASVYAHGDGGGSEYFYGFQEGNRGNYANYTGESLTLIFGATALMRPRYGQRLPLLRSAMFLHLERKRHRDGGDAQGFAALLDDAKMAGSSGSNIDYSVPGRVFASLGGSVVSGDGHSRAGADFGLFDDAAAVVAPIYYPCDGTMVAFRRAFTVAASAVGSSELVRLDFTGQEMSYLPIPPQAIFPGIRSAAWIFEWQ